MGLTSSKPEIASVKVDLESTIVSPTLTSFAFLIPVIK
tara:strand:- start:132 stop:245 length:114 start_codon:yes stop_codon:yes gene_type:complete